MKPLRSFLSLALALALLLPLVPSARAAEQPSAWASSAVEWIKTTGKLDRSSDFQNFSRTVTRRDFARLGVILTQILANRWIPDDLNTPFVDCDDLYVTKAAYIGIVNGVGENRFAPDDPVTREQIALMLLRVLDECGYDYYKGDVSALHFSDEDQISSWALDAVKRAYLIQAMNGTGGSAMSPKANLTMESAYQLLYNVSQNRTAIRSGFARSVVDSSVGSITLKYTGGGRYSDAYCEDAYSGQPAIYDIDGDGRLEIIAASYNIRCIDAASGWTKWTVPVGYDRSATTTDYVGRTWPSVFVGDIDGDGSPEIVTGHSDRTYQDIDSICGGIVAVYDKDGYFKEGWPQHLGDEVYAITVDDLDGDGQMEIIAGIGCPDGQNVWVYEPDGSVREGWPQLDIAHDGAKTEIYDNTEGRDTAYAWGIYNDNIATADLDHDGEKEIIVPSDVAQISVYNPDGTQLHTADCFAGGVVWGRVGVFSDSEYEMRVPNGGFGLFSDYMGNPVDPFSLPMTERWKATFTHSAAVAEDMDGDGEIEIAVVGAVQDRAVGTLPSLYQELYLFNADHTRYSEAWAALPSTTDAPLSEDWNLIERCAPDPVCYDLDGDGNMEILYPDFSGKLNCYWLDRQQHGSWPINVYDGETLEFACTPAIADLNGDGKVEVIFTTYTQKRDNDKVGSLCIADAEGNLLVSFSLPPTLDSASTVPNGCTSTPQIRDIDGDGLPEIILQTYLSGVTVYDVNP